MQLVSRKHNFKAEWGKRFFQVHRTGDRKSENPRRFFNPSSQRLSKWTETRRKRGEARDLALQCASGSLIHRRNRRYIVTYVRLWRVQLAIMGFATSRKFINNHNPAREKASAKRIQLNMGAVSFVSHFKNLALFARLPSRSLLPWLMDVPTISTATSKCTKSAAIVNVFTGRAVSVASVRLTPIVPAMRVVAAANAHPATAQVLLVQTTLTAEFSKHAVTDRANTHLKNVTPHLILPNLQALLLVQSLAHYFLSACSSRALAAG